MLPPTYPPGSNPPPVAPKDPAARGGFTMVEVIIAIVILAVGVLGLAGTTAYIVRQITLADLMTQRAVALQSTIERVEATPWASLASGSDSVGGLFGVQWSVAQETPQSRLVTIVTSGPGLQIGGSTPYPVLQQNVADTFVYRVINRGFND